jgi:hypothetical protein
VKLNEGKYMSYRERVAWLSLLTMFLTFGPYFILVSIEFFPEAKLPDLFQLFCYGVTAISQACLLGVGHLWLRRRFLQEANAPLDELDLQIKQRAMSIAYYVLMAGMIMVGVVMPFSEQGWKIVNSALFMIIVAEVVQQSLIVLGYRRVAS